MEPTIDKVFEPGQRVEFRVGNDAVITYRGTVINHQEGNPGFVKVRPDPPYYNSLYRVPAERVTAL